MLVDVNKLLLTIVLKTGSDTISVRSGHLNRKVFRSELGRLNRWSNR